jgi:protease IV
MMHESRTESQWQRNTIEKLIFTAYQEQRRNRRWNIFFRFVALLFFLGATGLWLKPFKWVNAANKIKPHVSLIEIRGPILEGSPASADNIITSLQHAFKDNRTAAILLRINSPGGSAVHAAQIYDEIQYWRHKYPEKKLYSICEDLCASAAYYIASASDYIYANSSSLVGSMGVIWSGFGFEEGLKKLGIERRVLTAGAHKDFLDPFKPLDEIHVQHFKGVLSDAHQQFIEAVKRGRGDRIKPPLDEEGDKLFSGLIWTGKQALPLGLIDGVASMQQVIREVIKIPTVLDYTVRPSLLQKLFDTISASFIHRIDAQLRPRLH